MQEPKLRSPEQSRAQAPLLEEFLALSRILTGIQQLDKGLGRQYLDRLRSTPFDSSLRQILERFCGLKGEAGLLEQVRKLFVEDDALRPALCQIILLWYTSAMQEPTLPNPNPNPNVIRLGTQQEYFSSLVWSVVGGHATGLSGGYFGHWRYRPDNEPPG